MASAEYNCPSRILMLELQKFMTALAMPIGTSLALGLTAFGAAALGRHRLAAKIGVAALAWLWLWSTPVVSDWLRAYIERTVPAQPVAAMPTADVIVVLGGAVAGAQAPWRPYADLGSAADRVWHAARLYHAGKAPRILLSAGRGVFPSDAGDEATAMTALLTDLGVPKSALILEGQSRTTAENALEAANILSSLKVRRVLLVTSALHMPRAMYAFRGHPFEVIPASTDVEIVPQPSYAMRWMPGAAALEGSTRAIHEVLGLARCRFVGC